MKTFEYALKVSADSQKEADEKMKALITILKKLSAPELQKIAGVVSNPVQLAFVKSKLM